MDDYIIKTEEMNRIMELLYRVLNVRITIFDRSGSELKWDNIKPPCRLCRTRRRDPAFDRLCVRCDRQHLTEAQSKGKMLIYRCHAGLMEGIVPLYDPRKNYLGAIVFGQVAAPDSPVRGVRSASLPELQNIGKLLSYLGEYICENELIRRRASPWSLRAEEYMEEHLAENITLEELARYSGCSVSGLSHRFQTVFGETFKKYLRRKKIRRAMELLREGRLVSECADLLGYFDAFYFSKDFKRMTGMAPSVWQKRETG